MSENSALRIHATIRPGESGAASQAGNPAREGPIRIVTVPRRKRLRKPRARLSWSDRLLRNTAIACAALLGILALGNVDAPWAKKASEQVRRALTMHIDLDESIGRLEFVREIMPESTLVFMNLNGSQPPLRPVDGALAHPWSNLQPWLMFECADGAEVRCIESGTVTAVSPMSGGLYGVLVDHGEGVETLYACLSGCDARAGEAVGKGDRLGASSDRLYFEYRASGESTDPAALLGL